MGSPTNIGQLAQMASRRHPNLHSTCKAFVASHNKSPYRDERLKTPGQYDISPSLVDVQIDENFQGQTASLTLLPHRPFQEMLYPGDWISIYMSSGANMPSDFGVEGDPERLDENIRVFFGFIDAVRESVTIDAGSGRRTVRISVSCSGTNKAFDRTSIYMNYSLGPNTKFGTSLPGLSALAHSVPMIGNPSTLIRAIALTYLGYGGQFLMPDSYPAGVGTEEERKNRLKSSLDAAIAVERVMGMIKIRGAGDKPSDVGTLQKIYNRFKKDIQPNSILALVDLFTYVEDFLIDGKCHTSPHDLQGSIWSLMMENANPHSNEMFLTLLPQMDLGGRISNEGVKDEWGMFPRYMPTLVMRERPFSWRDEEYRPRIASRRRAFRFGNVFFSSRQQPVVVPFLQQRDTTEALQAIATTPPSIQQAAVRDQGIRFIDRVKIQTQDITTETLGMSDNDTYNFFMASQLMSFLSNAGQKHFLVEDGLMPIFLAESIKRYGLRVREISTKFASAGTGKTSAFNSQDFLVRLLLLQDMWYQHQPWYRAGSITTYPIPKARVGMAMDVSGPGREETFYIEGIHKAWSISPEGGGTSQTTFTVTRGQPSGFSDSAKRFNYAPPDSVQIFLNGQQVHRESSERRSLALDYELMANPTAGPGEIAIASLREKPTQRVDKEQTTKVENADPASKDRIVRKFLNIIRVFETGKKDDSAFWYIYFAPIASTKGRDVGVSFGIIQFNQKLGTLPEYLRGCHNKNQNLFKSIFGSWAQNLLDTSWVRSANFKNEDLKERLIRSGKQAEFQEVQVALAKTLYFSPAETLAKSFGIKTERGFCMCFDTTIQFGAKGFSNSLDKWLERTKKKTGGIGTVNEFQFLTQFATDVDAKALARESDNQFRRTKELNSQTPAESLTDKTFEEQATTTTVVKTKVDQYTAAVQKERPKSPPKKDRELAGAPPWVVQENLRGEMYDPIDRPVLGEKQMSSIVGVINAITGKK